MVSSFLKQARSAAVMLGTSACLWSVTASLAMATFAGPVPTIPGGSDPRATVTNALNNVINFLALIAVAFVVVGGIRILAAGGNQEQVQGGKKTIIFALVGLAIVFFAKMIVVFVTQNVLS